MGQYILTSRVGDMPINSVIELSDEQAQSRLYATRIRKFDSELIVATSRDEAKEPSAEKAVAGNKTVDRFLKR